MYIKKICAKNYRNLANIELKPCKNINIICGDNAQGKTNLLEAIYNFSGKRDFRNTRSKEIKAFGESFALSEIDFFSHERKQKAKIVIEAKKKAFLNGVEVKNSSELTEQIHIISFSPDSISIIKEGPTERRNFLDNAVNSIYPDYSKHLSKYYRIVKQRNAILRRGKGKSIEKDLHNEYINYLAEYAIHIRKARIKYINKVMEFLPDIYNELTLGKENLDICYEYSEGVSGKNLNKEDFLKALQNCLNKDLEECATTIGPHHDDITFLIDGKNAKLYGSQGQQRSIILALKLAEAKIIKEICGEDPVALLDDVTSELDIKRQDYIFNHIKKWQVFITCCDVAQVQRMKKGKIYTMENGNIKEKTDVSANRQ